MDLLTGASLLALAKSIYYYGSYNPAIGIYTSCVSQVDNYYMDPLINLSWLPHVIALL